MRVIPVIDLMGGVVVRGIAGRRESYRPVESRIAADAQPATIARALVERFGFDTAYVADLDAIMDGRSHVAAWQEVAAAGLKLWVDAGVANPSVARNVLDQAAQAAIQLELVIGLESLESAKDLTVVCELCRTPPIFSLDLKEGQPLVRVAAWRHLSPIEIVLLAKSAGIRDLIVLDLADVGMHGGTRTLELCRQIRQVIGAGRLIAGGGVRGLDDLRTMADAGCDTALVASALHDGRLTRQGVGQAKNLRD